LAAPSDEPAAPVQREGTARRRTPAGAAGRAATTRHVGMVWHPVGLGIVRALPAQGSLPRHVGFDRPHVRDRPDPHPFQPPWARLGGRQHLVVSRRNAFKCRGGLAYRAVDQFITVSNAGYQALREGGIAADRIRSFTTRWTRRRLREPGPSASAWETRCRSCVAAFTAEKDHSTLLRAWDMVHKTAPAAHLVLAGDGPELARIQAQAEGLARVTFLGWRNDIPSLIKGADIVTLASREEGLGSSVAAQAKPVAITAVYDRQTALEPAGRFEALAKNLDSLCQNSPELDRSPPPAACFHLKPSMHGIWRPAPARQLRQSNKAFTKPSTPPRKPRLQIEAHCGLTSAGFPLLFNCSPWPPAGWSAWPVEPCFRVASRRNSLWCRPPASGNVPRTDMIGTRARPPWPGSRGNGIDREDPVTAACNSFWSPNP
jgi:hypothetical protein